MYDRDKNKTKKNLPVKNVIIFGGRLHINTNDIKYSLLWFVTPFFSFFFFFNNIIRNVFKRKSIGQMQLFYESDKTKKTL